MVTAITGTIGTSIITAVTGMGMVITTTDMDMATGTDMVTELDMVTAAMVMDMGTISPRALQISSEELCAS